MIKFYMLKFFKGQYMGIEYYGQCNNTEKDIENFMEEFLHYSDINMEIASQYQLISEEDLKDLIKEASHVIGETNINKEA